LICAGNLLLIQVASPQEEPEMIGLYKRHVADCEHEDKPQSKDPVAVDTLYRHEAVLTLLKDFCAGRSITLLKDITLLVVTEWQYTWSLKSPAAKRGRQEKVRNFFRFAVNHEYISKNPISAWKSVKLDTNDLHVSEDRIMKAVDEVSMTPENRERVKACMRLQRQAGLAIVDAVGLSKDELTKEAGRFRVKTSRQKTGTSVNNPSRRARPVALKGQERHPQVFFRLGQHSFRGCAFVLPEVVSEGVQEGWRRAYIP
jgi:hypothetical protein